MTNDEKIKSAATSASESLGYISNALQTIRSSINKMKKGGITWKEVGTLDEIVFHLSEIVDLLGFSQCSKCDGIGKEMHDGEVCVDCWEGKK